MAAAGATFGIPVSAVSLAGFGGIPVFLVLGAIAAVTGIVTAFVRGRGQIFPRNLIDEFVNREAPYTCDFCTATTLSEACDLTKPHYGDEYVSSELAETWRLKNPKAFVHLLNRDGELCASFGVLALSPSFTDQFCKGNVTDLRLSGSDVLEFEASRRAPKLYISGVVVRDPDSQLGHKRAVTMLWVMVRYLERLYGVRRKRTLYAIAVTPESEKLMKKVGFSIGCPGRQREDRADLYCLDLTSTTWPELKARVGVLGDSSTVCNCSF